MTKLFKNQINFDNEKKMATPKFIKFLIKINFLPIKMNKEKIFFKVQSKRFIIHFIIYWIPLILSFFYFWTMSAVNGLIDKMSRVSTFAEEFATYSTVAIVAAIFIPTKIAAGLNNQPLNLILNPAIRFPRHGAWTLASFLMMFIGSNIHMAGLLLQLDVPKDLLYKLFPSIIFTNGTQTLNWSICALLINAWIDNMKIDEFKSIELFIDNYRKYSKAFSSFFLCFFAAFQIFVIGTVFLCCSKFILKVNFIKLRVKKALNGLQSRSS